MDALFGLPRKKAAGESLRLPLHGHLFFEDQGLVDEYVGKPTKMKSPSAKVQLVCIFLVKPVLIMLCETTELQ